MNAFLNFLLNAVRNWHTTVPGVVAIVAGVTTIVHNPAAATDPLTIAAIASGIGAVAGKDANKTGIVSPPTEPPPPSRRRGPDKSKRRSASSNLPPDQPLLAGA